MLKARDKVKERPDAVRFTESLRQNGKIVVFTNGCFDLIHRGHVRYLEAARSLGDALIVGLNSDASVRRLKGSERPILQESDRAEVLAALASVDLVTIFDEDTPWEVIREIQPDVLVKGGDWAIDQIVGRDVVFGRGGKVVAIQFEQGYSTTGIIERIRNERRVSTASD